MLKPFFLLLMASGLAMPGFCQTGSSGYWAGLMDRAGAKLEVAFEFRTSGKSIAGYFNAPSQRATGIPLDSVYAKGDSLAFQLMSEPVTYFRGRVSGTRIRGKFYQEGFADGDWTLQRAALPAKHFIQLDTSFPSGDHRIACRIYWPLRPGKYPALLFLHGSGAEGMFANQYLAEWLAERGMVTMIQDKQGVGKSTGDWTRVNFEQLAADYVQALEVLKNFRQVNPLQMGIYGHSQGGTLAPLVATRSSRVAYVIAAASVGDSVYRQDLYRVENSLRSNGFSRQELTAAMAYYSTWLEMARTGKGFEKLDSLNQGAKDKKWLDWVEAPPQKHWIWNYYRGTGNYNSLDYWKKVTVPVLLVYGQYDAIEDLNHYLKNIDQALVATAGNKDVTEIILPRAQHNLCIFPDKGEPFFWWYLSHGYEHLINGWILQRF